jgi:hypothetical protein
MKAAGNFPQLFCVRSIKKAAGLPKNSGSFRFRCIFRPLPPVKDFEKKFCGKNQV